MKTNGGGRHSRTEAKRLGLGPWQLEMARAVPTDLIADITPRQSSVGSPSPHRPSTERPAAPTWTIIGSISRLTLRSRWTGRHAPGSEGPDEPSNA